jgi:competence protein CoiA
MQFALVDCKRSPPVPRLRGTCALCGDAAIAKCGTIKVWHWSHVSREHCDQWWERESEWHRGWKNEFPESWREVIRHDSVTGERHIADVETADGTVIELQYSSISMEELTSREAFYKNMIWVLDARAFSSRFQVLPPKLPSPDSKLLDELLFNEDGSRFRVAADHPFVSFGYASGYQREKYEWFIAQSYKGHHFFKWKSPRTTWLHASRPVVLDFDRDELLVIHRYGRTGRHCVQRVQRRDFLSEHLRPS